MSGLLETEARMEIRVLWMAMCPASTPLLWAQWTSMATRLLTMKTAAANWPSLLITMATETLIIIL